MAAASNFKNMVLCLTGVCLACSAILAGVYAVTARPIAATNEALLKASIGAVLPEGAEIEDPATVTVGGQSYTYYRATQGGNPVGWAVRSAAVGFGGPLTLMVGILRDGTVYGTSVLSHSETPGLGAKCTSDERFVAQWKGFDPAQKILSVKKDGGDVDAITASTITSRAYTQAVKNAVDVYNQLCEEEKND